jgi:hypothetical protein
MATRAEARLRAELEKAIVGFNDRLDKERMEREAYSSALASATLNNVSFTAMCIII